MTVYGDVVTAIEILLALILIVPFILWAYFKFNKGYFPREVKGEDSSNCCGSGNTIDLFSCPIQRFERLGNGLLGP